MTVTNSNSQKRAAILIEQGVEDSEFQIPKAALKEVGVEVVVLGASLTETYKGKQGKISVQPDKTTTEARVEDFDIVIIPGGMAPDKMRTNPDTVNFVKEAMAQNKVVAAVCHGPQVLIEGDLLRGKNATGFMSVRKDMENAGANYSDRPLVIDGNLITSRQPGDLAIFATAIINSLGFGGKQAALPNLDDPNVEWWKLADAWGGSTKGEIENALKTAQGEHYAREAFHQYTQKMSDGEVRSILAEICGDKERNIQRLEARLEQLGIKASGHGSNFEKVAKLKEVFHSDEDTTLLHRALGDLQAAVIQVQQFRNQLTDPMTVEIFDKIRQELMQSVKRLAKLYHERLKTVSNKAAQSVPSAAL